MSATKIKQELDKLNKKELIAFIIDLSKKNKSVSDYLDYFVNPDENQQFENYRKKVLEAFYPKRGFALKLKDGKQAITDFKKLEPSKSLLSELMLYYVECGVAYTNDFGDINEAFYVSLEKVYVQALQLMKKEDILEEFKEKAFKIMNDTGDIGWGFHDYLCQAYYDFYQDDDED
ncbi:MAG: DUF6155 family protein [Flavisolibacter sp.]